MADTHFSTEHFTNPSQPTPQASTCPPSSKRRKVIGQCPTCSQSFASRHDLRAHMADPSHHAPGSDSDAISFGELSSDYDSCEESTHAFKGTMPTARHDDEPTLETDGFEFSSSSPHEGPYMSGDGFDFVDMEHRDEDAYVPTPAPDQGSIHTLSDGDDQPSAEAAPIEIPPAKPRTIRGGALGVLYCGTCNRLFGNERVFKRHFMFAPRHGEEERDVRELYYRVWGRSWEEEAREMRDGRQVEEMEM